MPSLENPAKQPAGDGREIVSVRRFAAPPERVYAAFADPARLAVWWGPAGFTNTIHQFDLRPGGAWRLTMRGPDGTEYHNQSAFTEVVPLERIAFEHQEPVHRFVMTMTFTGDDGRTTLTWRMRFETASELARLGSFIAAANEQNFDRLAAHLAQTPSP